MTENLSGSNGCSIRPGDVDPHNLLPHDREALCGALSLPVAPPKITGRFVCTRRKGHRDGDQAPHVATGTLGALLVVVAVWRPGERPDVLPQDQIRRLVRAGGRS